MSDLIRRQHALEKTLAKYRRAAFSWGQNDCLKMARSHLVAMGHKPPKIPLYKTALGAKKALAKTGFKDLPALFDSLLPRISPAEQLPGDIVILKGESGLEGITVSVGTKVMGWHSDADRFVAMTPVEIEGAWRV